MDFPQIKSAIDQTSAAFKSFQESSDEKIAKLLDRIEELESKRNLPGPAGKPAPGLLSFKTASGIELPVLRSGERLSERVKAADSEFTLAQYVHDAVIGSDRKSVSSGPALTDTVLSQQIIDAVRAAMTLVSAGAPTVILGEGTGGMIMGRITGDPTVVQHTEGASDVSTSDVSVDAVTLQPKALVARVPLTAEVVADSPNLDLILNASLTAAFAQKLDSLGLATIIADTAVPESSVGQDPAEWAKVLAAVAEALAADQSLPSAMIGSEADFIARASQLASTAGSWLGKPPALASMTEFPTSKIAAGTALFGGFDRAIVVAMRQALRFEVVRFANAAAYSHELVAHARADIVVVQPGHLFRMLETVP